MIELTAFVEETQLGGRANMMPGRKPASAFPRLPFE